MPGGWSMSLTSMPIRYHRSMHRSRSVRDLHRRQRQLQLPAVRLRRSEESLCVRTAHERSRCTCSGVDDVDESVSIAMWRLEQSALRALHSSAVGVLASPLARCRYAAAQSPRLPVRVSKGFTLPAHAMCGGTTCSIDGGLSRIATVDETELSTRVRRGSSRPPLVVSQTRDDPDAEPDPLTDPRPDHGKIATLTGMGRAITAGGACGGTRRACIALALSPYAAFPWITFASEVNAVVTGAGRAPPSTDRRRRTALSPWGCVAR